MVVLVAMSKLSATLWLVAVASSALAEEEPAAHSIVPPEPIGSLSIPYPLEAPPLSAPVEVKVRLTIGVDGVVKEVELVQGAGEPFDSAVTEGAREFLFRPATIGAEPVEVVVPFVQAFVPPAPAPPEPETTDAVLEGMVIERGTRKPVSGAAIVAKDGRGERSAATDVEGRFAVNVASGEIAIVVVAQGYQRFLQVEKLLPRESLRVKYLIDRAAYDPYESVVVAERERDEISRATLSGREIHQLPGTLGDPFRVVSVLPGVTQMMTLLPMPVVRGSSPGDTGIFLDGERLPLLFHLFGGPSVIHPEFIERVDFFPGGFPVSYGGYTAGIVDGQTRRPREGENRLDLDLNLLQAGAFARQAIPGTSGTATLAARYGYPGMVLSALAPNLSLSYWDYQARFDGGSPLNGWSVFAYGARDAVRTTSNTTASLASQVLFAFHRIDLRYRKGSEDRNGTYRLVAGYDESQAAGERLSTRSWVLDPQASWSVPLSEQWKLHLGTELVARRVINPTSDLALTGTVEQASAVMQESGTLLSGGAFLEMPWKPVQRLLIVPGLRGDLYAHESATQKSVDPRLTVRFRPSAESDLWLKAAIGRYHQPPRLGIPMPGVDQSSLKLGLLASTQVGVGLEKGLAQGIDLDVQGYYNDMNPVVFDFQVNPTLAQMQPSGPLSLPGQLPSGDATPQSATAATIDRLFAKRLGHSYGLEVLLRKRDTRGAYGWIAYTLSRSMRQFETGWAPFDFDRTHIFNAVAGVRLPHNWELGGRLLLQSGTPVTTIRGYNSNRGPWQFRADLRVDKRTVWNTWLLDFYVDVVNTTVSEEPGMGRLNSMRYVLPTVGLRAIL
jgi:hypothetical protein